MNNITKLLFALLVTIMLPMAVYAQGWTKRIDRKFLETAEAMTATPDGGQILTGRCRDAGGIFTYFLVKVDTAGNVIWYHEETTTVFDPDIKQVVVLSTGEIMLYGFVQVTGSTAMSFLIKHSTTGVKLWRKDYTYTSWGTNGFDLLLLPGDDLVMAGNIYDYNSQPAEMEAMFYKVNSDGDSLKMVVVHDADTDNLTIYKAVPGHGNTIIALGSEGNNTVFMSLDQSLNVLWTQKDTLSNTSAITPSKIITTSDGGYMAAGSIAFTGGPPVPVKAFLTKVDATGGLQWHKDYHYDGNMSYGSGVVESAPGKYTIMGRSVHYINNGPSVYTRFFLLFADSNGDMLHYKAYSGGAPVSSINIYHLALLPGGGYLMAGTYHICNYCNSDVYLVGTDSLGNIHYGAIKGKLFGDNNTNCDPETGEPSLARWLITARGTDTIYTITDTAGNYLLDVGSGTYHLKATLAGTYWVDNLCLDSLTVTIPALNDTVTRNIAIGKTADCSDLQVQLSTPFLRRCIAGPAYTVTYCNNGTAPGANAYVELTLDTFLIIDSASILFTNVSGHTYRFNVGNVDANDCGSFLVYIRVECGFIDTSQTYCVDAHIFPQTECNPPDPNWDGARLSLSSDCQADSLEFRLDNTGNDMVAPQAYTIIQDDVMYVSNNIQLNAGQQLIRKVPANGSTWTFITSQTPGFPGNPRLVRSVEGCGVNNLGQFSLGYITMFPQTGPDANGDILCLTGIGSYDPNNKAAEPGGLGMEGLIDKNQQLTYTIRFQNTGSDTAFQVVIIDTLSADLDLQSIRNVSASHPMTWTIKPGRVLEIIFANILLPDSNVNEPASHGSITFVIDLADDLPNGTEITNTAYIYFDMNKSVVTNTTLNTVGELFKTWLTIIEVSDPLNKVSCYPNPSQGSLNLELEGEITAPVSFRVYDLAGKLAQEQTLTAGNYHHINLKVTGGMYLYEVYTGSQKLGSGKLVVYK
jgi:uncharacterized repeat protein (TIGR01451 family)